jgi:hypothetical protein
MSEDSGSHIRPRSHSTQIPRSAQRILLSLLPDEVRDCVSGDLAEIFETVILPSCGTFRARLWYWKQVLCSLRLILKLRKSSLPALESWRGQIRMDTPRIRGVAYHSGIRIDKIPVQGPAGLLFVFATVFIFGVGLPAVRQLLMITGIFGMLGSGLLIYWHKRHALKIRPLNLHASGSPKGAECPERAAGKEDPQP